MSEILNLEGEIWRPIKHPSIGDYSKHYMVSNKGRVKSLRYRQTNEEKLLKMGRYKNGYLYVTLCRNSKPKHYTVHRLVALTFIKNPRNLLEVNHLDENKSNNTASNLCWVSRKENINYGTGLARRMEKRKETIKTSDAWREARKKQAAKLSKQVYQYSQNGELVKTYPSLMEAARQTGFKQCNFRACPNDKYKYKIYNNFVWSYTELTSKEVIYLFESAKKSKQSKRCKKVYQYTIDGVLVNIYPSVKQAAQETGYNQGNISSCCQSERVAYGFIFRYEPLPNTSNQLTLFPIITKKIS